MGIENELISFKDGERISFNNYFNSLINSFDYNISGRSVRTETGHGFYVDGSEIEILTPPVKINKGFATRLTDLLMIGRDRVVESTPKLEHTGYSVHWNITNGGKIESSLFYEGIAVPFHLFGLTPLSIGLKLREKDNRGRYEILGDSINNEEQINATALLLGAYAYAIENEGRTPLQPQNCSNSLFLPNGRFNEIAINSSKANFEGNIQVQQYLELFYQWINPLVNKLGTKKEIENLEEFISGIKKLEFDNLKYYSHLKDLDAKDGGVYLPITTKDLKNPVHILKRGKERDLPLEGRLLGEIIKQKKNDIREINWTHINLNNGEHISGIDGIYKFAQKLNEDLPKLKRTYNIKKIEPNEIEKIEPKAKISYNPINDNSIFMPEIPKVSYYLKQKLREKLVSKNFLWKMALSAMLASLIGLATYSTYDKIDTSYQADKIVNEAIINNAFNQKIQDDNITEQESLEDIENGKNNR